MAKYFVTCNDTESVEQLVFCITDPEPLKEAIKEARKLINSQKGVNAIVIDLPDGIYFLDEEQSQQYLDNPDEYDDEGEYKMSGEGIVVDDEWIKVQAYCEAEILHSLYLNDDDLEGFYEKGGECMEKTIDFR